MRKNFVQTPELRTEQFVLVMEIEGPTYDTFIYANRIYDRVYKRVVYARANATKPVTRFVVGKPRDKYQADEFRTMTRAEAHLATIGARRRK